MNEPEHLWEVEKYLDHRLSTSVWDIPRHTLSFFDAIRLVDQDMQGESVRIWWHHSNLTTWVARCYGWNEELEEPTDNIKCVFRVSRREMISGRISSV